MSRFAPWFLLGCILLFFGGCSLRAHATVYVQDPISPALGKPLDWGPVIQKACQTASDSGDYDVRYLHPPKPGEFRGVYTPIVIKGAPFCRVDLNLTALFPTLQFQQPGVMFRFVGLKWSILRVQGILLTKDGSTGIAIDGDADHQSTSHVKLQQCGVTIAPTVKNSVCYQLGGPTSNDVSNITMEQCDSNWSGFDAVQGSTLQKLTAVHNAGNRGVQIYGYNTCGIFLNQCTWAGMDVAVATCKVGSPSGGDGLTISDGTASYCVLGVWLDGYFPLKWTGGRWELGGAMLLSGNPLTSGRGTGRITVSDVIFDSYVASANKSLGYVDDGVLFGIYSNASARIDAVGGYGNSFDPSKWIGIRSNLSPGPTITAERSLASAAVVPIEGNLAAQK